MALKDVGAQLLRCLCCCFCMQQTDEHSQCTRYVSSDECEADLRQPLLAGSAEQRNKQGDGKESYVQPIVEKHSVERGDCAVCDARNITDAPERSVHVPKTGMLRNRGCNNLLGLVVSQADSESAVASGLYSAQTEMSEPLIGAFLLDEELSP